MGMSFGKKTLRIRRIDVDVYMFLAFLPICQSKGWAYIFTGGEKYVWQ
jgi:hypothetical protein